MQVQVHQTIGDAEMTTKSVSADVSWTEDEVTIHLPDESGLESVSIRFEVTELLKRIMTSGGYAPA